MAELSTTAAPSRPEITITLFRDARDVIPDRTVLPWDAFCALVAPARPELRIDVAGAAQRQLALIDDVCGALLVGRVVTRFQHLPAHRELEKVAFRAQAEGLSPDELIARVRERAEQLRHAARRRVKTRLACWSPTVYRRHETRGVSGVEAVTCLVLDYDDGTSIEDAVDAWEGWPLLVHTSWSHAEAHPRFRLVLPLAEPILATAWPRVWAWARDRSGGHIDEACKDPSRLYLRPAIPRPDALFRALVRDGGGPLLTVDPAVLAEPAGGGARRAGVGVPSSRPLQRVRVSGDRARQIARHRLRTSRDVRERAAQWLGARISGRRAERVACPSCGRRSVWFWLEPGRMSTAQCNHRDSCGWWGHLDELLEQQGGSLGR